MSAVSKEKIIENAIGVCNLRSMIMICDKMDCTPQIRKKVKKLKMEYEKLKNSSMQDIKEFFGIDENTSSERLKETADILVKMVKEKQTGETGNV